MSIAGNVGDGAVPVHTREPRASLDGERTGKYRSGLDAQRGWPGVIRVTVQDTAFTPSLLCVQIGGDQSNVVTVRVEARSGHHPTGVRVLERDVLWGTGVDPMSLPWQPAVWREHRM